MSCKVEKLDTKNIFEIQEINEKLKGHPDLLSIFRLLVIIANKRLNDDRILNAVEDIMEDEELWKLSPMPDLSDHSSDEEDLKED
tara:strand:- start:347 stop:601 length:255 start_codon:yes stop_codon:yes gene_type:complete